jgi:hypothetical protein
VATQFQGDWWIVLGVAPSSSKDDIVRNFRNRIKQYHPDRIVGFAPEFVQLAEEHTKALNEAYENAMRCRYHDLASARFRRAPSLSSMPLIIERAVGLPTPFHGRDGVLSLSYRPRNLRRIDDSFLTS